MFIFLKLQSVFLVFLENLKRIYHIFFKKYGVVLGIMINKQTLLVQIIHVKGPYKGQIQEFRGNQIIIGRHPDSHVFFPNDLTTMSRKHAIIQKEGDRFKLIDTSSNGTFVNKREIKEILLNDGDIITFAEGGPQISILTVEFNEKESSLLTHEPVKPQMPETIMHNAHVQNPSNSLIMHPSNADKI